MKKCEIIEKSMKIKIYEIMWGRLYIEVRRVKIINEELGEGFWRVVMNWVWKMRSYFSFKNNIIIRCACRIWSGYIVEDRMER